MRSLLAISVVAGLVAASGTATAGVTVDLLFVARNGSAIAATDTVTADPGDTLTMAVRFTNDVPLTGIALSLNYDLDGDDELDVVRATQWAGVQLNKLSTVTFSSFQVALGPSTQTFIGSFTGGVIPGYSTLTLPPNTYQIGTVTWTVNAGVNSDGADILTGFLIPGFDGLLGSGFADISDQAMFHSATVNLIPEPGTAGLLCAGLFGLVALSRRPAR